MYTPLNRNIETRNSSKVVLKCFSCLIVICGIILFPASSLALPIETIAPELSAEGVVILGWKNGKHEVVLEKNWRTLYPVASITKLSTALVVQDLYPPNHVFEISPLAVSTLGISGGLSVGQRVTRDELLAALLIESSNDAAVAFAEPVGSEEFLFRMNEYLASKRLAHRKFTNVTGLDPRNRSTPPNSLTPYGSALLVNLIYKNNPVLSSIMSHKEVAIHTVDGDLIKNLTHTNKVLDDSILANKIIMSKTGTTTRAKEALVMVTVGDRKYDYYTISILRSSDRVSDARLILNTLYKIDTAR